MVNKMDDTDYNNLSRTKMAMVIAALICIPLFALRFYHLSLEQGAILKLQNKFKVVHLERNCHWTLEKNYNHCFKKDFLQFVRSKTYYEGILAFDLFLTIKEHDYLKQTTDLGKMYSRLDSLELIISFFEINKSKSINRDKADFVGLIFAYFLKTKPIESFYLSEKEIIELEKKFKNIMEAKPVLKNRFQILKTRFNKLKKELRTL